jgi:hypothetical protein
MGIQLTPEDDGFHVPANDDPWWSETTWFTFMVPDRRLSITVYPWIRANQGIYGGGVYAWDHTGRFPWDVIHYDYEWNHPYPHPGDLRDIEFPNGVRIQCLEPLRTYRIGYDHPNCTIDVVFDATVDAHALGSEGADDASGTFAGHIDQQGRVTGRVVLGGEELAIDCYASRDRSWGRRVPAPDLRIGYDVAVGPTAAFVVLSDPATEAVMDGIGYVWLDGERAPLASGRRVLEHDGWWPDRVTIDAVDTLGRSIRAVGKAVNWIAFPNVSSMLNLISLARYDLTTGSGDQIGLWGDTQETWHVEPFRAFVRGG